MKYKMTARARVNPTEDLDKVITAISNIFKFDELEIGDGYVIVTGDVESLLDLRESLKNRKIRDTAQRIFLKGVSGNRITFSLSKQAALVSIPNLVDREMSSLGEIDVTIETDDVEGFIEWMTAKS
ncbi:MAG: RNA-binding domain-containing protein [Methanobacterium sp.]